MLSAWTTISYLLIIIQLKTDIRLFSYFNNSKYCSCTVYMYSLLCVIFRDGWVFLLSGFSLLSVLINLKKINEYPFQFNICNVNNIIISTVCTHCTCPLSINEDLTFDSSPVGDVTDSRNL